MPMRISDYPPTWRAISRTIRFERAQGQCEAVCADGVRCGAVHGQFIHRLGHYPEGITPCKGVNGADWRVCLPCRPVTHDNVNAWGWAPRIRIILTTAHTCTCDPLCDDDAHLLALCQLHHLRLDAAMHGRNARRTRTVKVRAAAVEAGQLELA